WLNEWAKDTHIGTRDLPSDGWLDYAMLSTMSNEDFLDCLTYTHVKVIYIGFFASSCFDEMTYSSLVYIFAGTRGIFVRKTDTKEAVNYSPLISTTKCMADCNLGKTKSLMQEKL
ncbi:hypothetical protein ACJX0J_015609, partial [Zea mays]